MTFWGVLGYIGLGIAGLAVVMFLVFLLSRIQMRAWATEIESFLRDSYLTKKFNQNEKGTQE
jgi:hypothetical protein